MKELILPSTYKYDPSKGAMVKGIDGMPKLSYSQYSNWITDTEYKCEYIRERLLGLEIIKPEGFDVYAKKGNALGARTQFTINEELDYFLSEDEIAVIDEFNANNTLVNYGESFYEKEILILREGYCIQGFMDRFYVNGNKAIIRDDKTGSKNKKSKYTDKYFQTRLYAYWAEQQGYTIDSCGVDFFLREGSHFKNDIKIVSYEGYIETPYKKEDVEKHLRDVDSAAIEISDMNEQIKYLQKNKLI